MEQGLVMYHGREYSETPQALLTLAVGTSHHQRSDSLGFWEHSSRPQVLDPWLRETFPKAMTSVSWAM